MRKFLLLSIILFLVGIALASYYGLQEPSNKEALTKNPTTVQKITTDPAISPVSSLDGRAIWYADKQGKIFRTDLSGSNVTEYPMPFFLDKPLREIRWSQDADFIAVGTLDNQNSYTYYDSKTKLYTPLAKNVIEMDWLPDGQRIVLVWQSNDKKNQQLVVSNADGSGYRVVANLPAPEFIVKASPTGKEALLLSSKSNAENGSILFYNLEDGTQKTLIEGKNIDIKWIGENQFLYTKAGDSAWPEVYIYNLKTSKSDSLGINTNLDRISPLNTTQLIAATTVTTNGNEGDKFVRVNLNDLSISEFFVPNPPKRAFELFSVNGYSFFIESTTGHIFSLK
ncbi:MAG TPA: hypothetical protein VD998_02585 [Verrucomicrobiae bacterium]|nr:hypothetical protein [Verrucomicrobiae bacterium]